MINIILIILVYFEIRAYFADKSDALSQAIIFLKLKFFSNFFLLYQKIFRERESEKKFELCIISISNNE